MGRKERRAKERQERKESIRMTPDRIYELKQKTANEAVRRVQEIEKGKEKQRAETALDMLLLFGIAWMRRQSNSRGRPGRADQGYWRMDSWRSRSIRRRAGSRSRRQGSKGNSKVLYRWHCAGRSNKSRPAHCCTDRKSRLQASRIINRRNKRL